MEEIRWYSTIAIPMATTKPPTTAPAINPVRAPPAFELSACAVGVGLAVVVVLVVLDVLAVLVVLSVLVVLDDVAEVEGEVEEEVEVVVAEIDKTLMESIAPVIAWSAHLNIDDPPLGIL